MLCIGDSITEGAWALTTRYNDSATLPRNTDARGSYPQQLARLLRIEVYNCGLNGWSFIWQKSGFPLIDSAMDYACKDVSENDPDFDVITVAIGHNHAYNHTLSDTDFETYYTTLINKLKSIHPESHIICFSLFSPTWANAGDGVGVYRNTSIQTVAAATGCTFVDCSTMPASYVPVGGHPNPAGALCMALWLSSYLDEYFTEDDTVWPVRQLDAVRSLTS
jgi:lysophospholipase L1-like esterase